MQVVQEVQPALSEVSEFDLLTLKPLKIAGAVVWRLGGIVGEVVAVRTERPDAVTADMEVGTVEAVTSAIAWKRHRIACSRSAHALSSAHLATRSAHAVSYFAVGPRWIPASAR
jgi:hypothetical protein